MIALGPTTSSRSPMVVIPRARGTDVQATPPGSPLPGSGSTPCGYDRPVMLEALGIIVVVALVFIVQEVINRWLYWNEDGKKVRRYREADLSHRESWLRRKRGSR